MKAVGHCCCLGLEMPWRTVDAEQGGERYALLAIMTAVCAVFAQAKASFTLGNV